MKTKGIVKGLAREETGKIAVVTTMDEQFHRSEETN